MNQEETLTRELAHTATLTLDLQHPELWERWRLLLFLNDPVCEVLLWEPRRTKKNVVEGEVTRMMREKADRNRRTRLSFQRLQGAIYLGGERKHSLLGRSREAQMGREARAEVAAGRGNGVNPSALLLARRKGGFRGPAPCNLEWKPGQC